MNDPKNILLTSANKLGDAIAFLPTATAIRQLFPESRITMLTGGPASEAACLTNLIDEFIPLPANRVTWLIKLAPDIRKRRFDLGIMASGDSSYVAAAMWLGGVKERVGFADSRLSFLLTNKCLTGRGSETELEAERNFRLARALGAEGAMPRPPCEIDAALRERANARWAQLGIRRDGPLVLVHPGSSTARRWPPENFATLCTQLAEAGCQPVVLEGPAETGLGDIVAGLARGISPVLKRVEGIDLLAAMMRDCGLFIGHSSGPLHVAVLAGVRSVSLWGDTDPAIWGPAWERERHVILRTPMPCAPCEHWTDRHVVVRGAARPECEECMGAITVDAAVEAAMRQLKEAAL